MEKSSNEETHEKPELPEGKRRMNGVGNDDDGEGGSQRTKCSFYR